MKDQSSPCCQKLLVWSFDGFCPVSGTVNSNSSQWMLISCFVIIYFISTGVDIMLSWQVILCCTGTKFYFTFIVKAGEVECNSYLFIAFEYRLFSWLQSELKGLAPYIQMYFHNLLSKDTWFYCWSTSPITITFITLLKASYQRKSYQS